jgi:hypothetical protein
METDGVEQVTVTPDRPIRIALGDVDILRGTLTAPRVIPAEGQAYGIGDKVEWEINDRWQDFADYTFASARAYDGVTLNDAITDIVTAAGFSSGDISISTDAFILPYTPGVSFGEWQLYPERGDTAAIWLDKLHSDFAATWQRGWVPTLAGYKYSFTDPADFDAGPHVTLYMSAEDARAASVTSALVASRVVRSETRWLHQAEANQILVVGQDRRTKKLLTAQYNDTASQTPSTTPASRPENWRGKVIRYQLIDPLLLTTQDAVDRARDILEDRLTPVRHMIEVTCDILVRSSDDRPIWIGDVMRIYAKGRGSYEDWRIIAIPSMEFIHEDQTGSRVSVRAGTYRARKIGEG